MAPRKPKRDAVSDATKPFRLRAIREDLAVAEPGRPESCVLAQAALRHKNVAAVSIGASVALVRFTNGKVKRYVISPKDQAIIRAFDDSSLFPFISVTLQPPPPAKQIGARRGTPAGSNQRSGTKHTLERHLNRPASRRASIPEESA
jgi:hypothetical protein